MAKSIKYALTTKGYRAMWERGGATSTKGDSVIVCGPTGQPKDALFIRTGGHLCNNQHCLIPVLPGDYIVMAERNKDDLKCSVWLILTQDQEKVLETQPGFMAIKLEYDYTNGEWDQNPPSFLDRAINAANDKCRCFHCRHVHYATTKHISPMLNIKPAVITRL